MKAFTLIFSLFLMFTQANAHASKVIEVTSNEEFKQEVLNSKVPVLVEFYATWCHYCQDDWKEVKDVAADFKDRIKVVAVEYRSEAGQNYKTEQGFPEFHIYLKGEDYKYRLGFQDYNALVNWIEKRTEVLLPAHD